MWRGAIFTLHSLYGDIYKMKIRSLHRKRNSPIENENVSSLSVCTSKFAFSLLWNSSKRQPIKIRTTLWLFQSQLSRLVIETIVTTCSDAFDIKCGLCLKESRLVYHTQIAPWMAGIECSNILWVMQTQLITSYLSRSN